MDQHIPIAPQLVDKETLTKVYLGGISLRNLDNMVQRKAIPFVKIGRRVLFDPVEVVAYFKERSR